MASLALVEVWRGRKLPRMLVAVAVGAALKLDFEQGVLTLREMTLRALQAGMFAFQGICRSCVFLHAVS